MILGIDPGLSGGVALLARDGGLQFAEAMPTLRNAVPTVDVGQLGEWMRLHAAGAVVFACVERAQAMPRQGVSSAFNYGCVFGSMVTALAGLGIGYELVAPAKWKRAAGLGAEKRQALDLVRQLYPRLLLKRKDDGIAEAILIARWGLRHAGTGVAP